MKITNAELLDVKEPLTQLIKVKFPVKVSMALAKMAYKLEEYLIPVERVREGLIDTYGQVPKDSTTGLKSIRPGNEGWDEFLLKVSELLKTEQDIDITPINLPATFEIETAALMALDKFIKVA